MTVDQDWFVCPTCKGQGGSNVGPWASRPEIQDGDIEIVLTSKSSKRRKEAALRLMEGAWQDGWDAATAELRGGRS